MTSQTKPKYSYTPQTSPWNTKTLYILWSVQVAWSLFLTIFGVALIPKKYTEDMKDDGFSNLFYILAVSMTAGSTLSTLGCTLCKYLWHRSLCLHPGWSVVLDTFQLFLWIAVLACGVLAPVMTLMYNDGLGVYGAVEVLSCTGFVPFLVGLVYAGRVYSEFRKGRLGRDAEGGKGGLS